MGDRSEHSREEPGEEGQDGARTPERPCCARQKQKHIPSSGSWGQEDSHCGKGKEGQDRAVATIRDKGGEGRPSPGLSGQKSLKGKCAGCGRKRRMGRSPKFFSNFWCKCSLINATTIREAASNLPIW